MPERRFRLRGVDKYLAPSEHVLHTCRRHWIVILKPTLLWLLVIGAGAVVGFVLSPEQSNTWLDRILGVGALITTLYAGYRVADWAVAAYVITDQRVLFLEGLVSRNVSAIPLSKVTDTTFRRSILGRMFGYGDLMLDSPGEKPGLSTLTVLPRPVEMYRLIMSLVVNKDRGEEPLTPVPLPEPSEPDEDETGPIPKITV